MRDHCIYYISNIYTGEYFIIDKQFGSDVGPHIISDKKNNNAYVSEETGDIFIKKHGEINNYKCYKGVWNSWARRYYCVIASHLKYTENYSFYE